MGKNKLKNFIARLLKNYICIYRLKQILLTTVTIIMENIYLNRERKFVEEIRVENPEVKGDYSLLNIFEPAN